MEGLNQEQINTAWQRDKVLGECMIELYENNLWTDVKFKCSDSETYERVHAHKIVLAARSPVFQELFFGTCTDVKEEIVLDSTTEETFDLFLRFLYKDEVTLTEAIAASVFEIAHYYQVTNLMRLCIDFLASCITSENVCNILSLARRYDVSSLCNICCIFIDKNVEEVMASEGFLNLAEEDLTYILKGDTFYGDEKSIFKKAEEWVLKKIEERRLDKSGQNIRKVFGKSFFYLRLPCMTTEMLLNCTRKKGYLSADEYEDLVDYKNETPGTTVKSNSCVPRLPTVERVYCTNTLGMASALKDVIITHFQVSVNRDVKLKSIELEKMYPHLKYSSKLYSNKDCKKIDFSGEDFNSLFQTHRNKVFQSCSLINTQIKELKEVLGQDMPDGIFINISGFFKVTCQKDKAEAPAANNDAEEYLSAEHSSDAVNENDENDGSDDDNGDREKYADEDEDEDEDELDSDVSDDGKALKKKEYDIFQKHFEMLSMDEKQRIIEFDAPLILEKSRSPYDFSLKLEYRNVLSVAMKTVDSKRKRITSEHGEVKLKTYMEISPESEAFASKIFQIVTYEKTNKSLRI